MARKRYISSDISIDEAVTLLAEANPQAALMWPWLLLAFDDWGRADLTPRKIKFQIFPAFPFTSEEIANAINDIAASGLLYMYEIDGVTYGAVNPKTWIKYQTYLVGTKWSKSTASQIPIPENPPWGKHIEDEASVMMSRKKQNSAAERSCGTETAAAEAITQLSADERSKTQQNARNAVPSLVPSLVLEPKDKDKDTEDTSYLRRDDQKSIAQPDDEFPIYISREEIPLMFSETVDLLLAKTGRTAIAPDELDALRELDRLHTPARVQQEITRSVARFKSRSRPLSELTFCYLLDALRHQTTRKQGPPPDDIPYDAVAKAWNEILAPHGKPEVTELHDKRKYAIARIWREAKGFSDIETWEKFFRYVSKTKFMAFEGCGFDWLTDYENFVKAREGTYTQ
jgi:hypothetical protein